jgi:arsenate reductase
MDISFPNLLSTLGHEGRLDVFRLLVRRFPEQVPAGELAQALDTKQNTMSAYLSTLHAVDLITQTRQGRSILYRANMDRADTLIDFLFADCCRGRPQSCQIDPAANTRKNVLFVCTGNSARSLFAEAILRDLAGDRFDVYSAGTAPARGPNLRAMQVLRDKGFDTSELRSKHIRDVRGPDAPHMDFVFTVCDTAANEDCPLWPGLPISAHWGVPDPVAVQGTDAEKRLAFQQAYGTLKNRLEAFAALDMSALDRAALQREIDLIPSLNISQDIDQ